jgi:hypothetical protein
LLQRLQSSPVITPFFANQEPESLSHPQTAKLTTAPEFPFVTEADDHCESPLDAYHDIMPLLKHLSGNETEKFCIYDPYYCDGGVTQNLKELGFPNVYNRKEDCYAVWSDVDQCPKFDCLVTNPPYSADHIERLVKHVTSSTFATGKPWFLLLPQWVHKKEFYQAATDALRPFYLVPHKRYVYVPPKDFRESRKSDVHKKSSPFVSMWYVYGGSAKQTEAIIRTYLQIQNAPCDLARSKSALRDLRRKKR